MTNRGNGSITVINFATGKILATWRIPGGGSPDMGGVSPDGPVLWVSGRYNNVVYAISTATGQLLAEDPGGTATARAVRVAAAGPLLPGPHRDHPVSIPGLRPGRAGLPRRMDAGGPGPGTDRAGAVRPRPPDPAPCSPGWALSRSAPPRCAPGQPGRLDELACGSVPAGGPPTSSTPRSPPTAPRSRCTTSGSTSGRSRTWPAAVPRPRRPAWWTSWLHYGPLLVPGRSGGVVPARDRDPDRGGRAPPGRPVRRLAITLYFAHAGRF